jgi:hypothetical protein
MRHSKKEERECLRGKINDFATNHKRVSIRDLLKEYMDQRGMK